MKYKKDYEQNKSNVTSVEETPEMKIAKDLKPVKSQHEYTKDYKDTKANIQVDQGILIRAIK